MLMKLARKVAFSRVGFFAAGAAAMYFYDPERGRDRRDGLADRAQQLARQQVQGADKQVTYLQDRAKGAAKAANAGSFTPESGNDLREHLRQVVSGLAFPTAAVTIDVSAGRVAVRGEVDSDQHRRQLLKAVRDVKGAEDVEDFTHLPGEIPPKKASTLLD